MVSYSSFYQILKIPDTATGEEIKSAFRKLALLHHPDQNKDSPEAEAEFRVIHNAYSVLADQTKKQEYDAWLKTGSVFTRDTAKSAATGTSLMVGTDHPFGSLEALLSHLNFLLWEIEDLLQHKDTIEGGLEYDGKPFTGYVLDILIFIDQWILNPAGFPDYFWQARGEKAIDISLYFNNLRDKIYTGDRSYGPFVNITDYFYTLRQRMDKFLQRAKARDVIKSVPGHDLRIIDCIFEAQDFALHNLFHLKKILAGESEHVPPFEHSRPIFDG